MNQKVFQSLNDIIPELTAHGKGSKFVFLQQKDTLNALTQFAYGKLMRGEDAEPHLHTTMEEYFYFISGEGEYLIDACIYKIKPGTFIRIPHNTIHALKAHGEKPLTFVYFGIAVELKPADKSEKFIR